jgi:hypothetical protein
LQQDDVDLADVDPGFHLVQVRHGHDFSAAHHGGAHDAFAELGVEFADGAGEGRVDLGFAEFLLGAVEGGAGDLDLVTRLFELLLGDFMGGLVLEENRVGDESGLKQTLVALKLLLGLAEIRLGECLAGLGRLESWLRRICGWPRNFGFDFDQEIALLTCWPSLTGSSMISPLTSALILTSTVGWMRPLATTVSVMSRRLIFSAWMGITGSCFRSRAITTRPVTPARIKPNTMILRRLRCRFGVMEL